MEMVQFGGVGIMAVDDVSHRVVGQGQDATGLRRWAWIRLKGKQGHFLRVASAYRPVHGQGPGTVHSQHEHYLGQHDRDEEPRTAFYTDLRQEVARWKERGNHINVGLDANEDVRHGDTAVMFQDMEMRELILQLHSTQSPPSTCDKNHRRRLFIGSPISLG
jgi:hypothetical protein